MEYEEVIDYVSTLDFVPDKPTADAMIRAVLGILCSSVELQDARMLCDHLPEPLTVEDLRGYQVRKNKPPFEAFIQEIRTEFGLNDEQALELVDAVLRVTREACGLYAWGQFTKHLPADVGEALNKP